VADEPRPIVDDIGPTPYDLLLAGLGACTSMTVRMCANRKRWPLKRIRVTLRHSRIHEKEWADCETMKGAFSPLELT
jgi:putative redox protein